MMPPRPRAVAALELLAAPAGARVITAWVLVDVEGSSGRNADSQRTLVVSISSQPSTWECVPSPARGAQRQGAMQLHLHPEQARPESSADQFPEGDTHLYSRLRVLSPH